MSTKTVEARTISSGTTWLTNPSAILLGRMLQPLCVEYDAPSVAADSQCIIYCICVMDCEVMRNTCVASYYV